MLNKEKTKEELMKEIKKLQKQLAEFEKLKTKCKLAALDQLATSITHELNQPLTGIKGFAQAALIDLDKKKLLKGHLQKIVEQADRIDGIISNVRLFARKSEFNQT
jgi:two-component system C4-dicarboxylate transport sensor histidine kinase DctB